MLTAPPRTRDSGAWRPVGVELVRGIETHGAGRGGAISADTAASQAYPCSSRCAREDSQRLSTSRNARALFTPDWGVPLCFGRALKPNTWPCVRTNYSRFCLL